MIIRVDSTAALPVYEQIREQVVRMVMAGTLEEGTRMPTIRQLANDLKLAKGTVAKAYALLEDEAVVESKGTRGTFVAAVSAARLLDEGALAEAALLYATTARQLGASLDRAQAEIGRRWIHE